MTITRQHSFLSEKFLEVLQRFSKLGLYGYTEAERKTYDFACNLTRDWSRIVVGQTIWTHKDGIRKDISTMITDPHADICVYIVRDKANYLTTIQNAIDNYRRNPLYSAQLSKLRIFRVPDFDANKEEERKIVGDNLEREIVNDLLFNVIFEKLSARDIDFLLNNVVAYLILLRKMAVNGPTNDSGLKAIVKGSDLDSFSYIWTLYVLGFLEGNHLASPRTFCVSPKGHILLALIEKMEKALDTGAANDELSYILDCLGLNTEINGETTFREIDIFEEKQSPAAIHEKVFGAPKLTRFLTLAKLAREELPFFLYTWTKPIFDKTGIPDLAAKIFAKKG